MATSTVLRRLIRSQAAEAKFVGLRHRESQLTRGVRCHEWGVLRGKRPRSRLSSSAGAPPPLRAAAMLPAAASRGRKSPAKSRPPAKPSSSAAASSSDSLSLSSSWASYALRSVVGEGTFSVVYRARHRPIGGAGVPLADCAVKVIKENDFVRIRDEVAALADLDGHPNVVGLLDVMEDGEGYAIAMPFFAHDDFGRALRKGASASAIRRAIFGAIL